MKLKLLIIIGFISTSFLIYLALIDQIEKEANFIINKQLSDVDGQLIIRLRENKIKQQILLDELEDNLSKIKKNQKTIQSITNLSKDNISKLHIETGILALSNKEQTNLSTPNGCEANRGLVKEKILFDRAYNVAPEIFTSFYLLDFAHGTDHRLKLEVSDITNTSFNITYITWCDTRISQSKAKWLAIGL
jgi:hypothetical protein